MGVGLSNRLQKLQNRAARVIMNFSNDIPGPVALNALGWENLVTRRAKTKAKTMYKVLNKLAPSPLEKLFEHKRNIGNLSFSVSLSYIMVIAKDMVKGDFRGNFEHEKNMKK